MMTNPALREFHFDNGVYRRTPLNTSAIDKDSLDIKRKVRSNPLPWNGQFSPQLIETLLQEYANEETSVFDPFLGSGTVLLEAGLHGIQAVGTELNPAAFTLSRLYEYINIPIQTRQRYLKKISILLQEEFKLALPLFHGHESVIPENTTEELQSKLIETSLKIDDRLENQLLEALIILLDFGKANFSVEKIFSTWKKISQLITSLPFSESPIKSYLGDARRTPIPNQSIDLIITSPPYINVFNYHQQYRMSAEALQWDPLSIAKSEIGSNRKHRNNRLFTVIQYCLDISQVFHELARVCKTDSRLIFIVGRESTVRGMSFYNGEIVAEIAGQCLNFNLLTRQERVFVNRFGSTIVEDILHFSPPTEVIAPEFYLERSRGVSDAILKAAYSKAPEEIKDDIGNALENVYRIEPSPIFQLSKEPE